MPEFINASIGINSRKLYLEKCASDNLLAVLVNSSRWHFFAVQLNWEAKSEKKMDPSPLWLICQVLTSVAELMICKACRRVGSRGPDKHWHKLLHFIYFHLENIFKNIVYLVLVLAM